MRRLLFILSLLAPWVEAAPMTVKEIGFLVRQRTPETEILDQTRQRRLLQALDPASMQALAAVGASPALIAALRDPALLLPAQEAATLARRTAPAPASTPGATPQKAPPPPARTQVPLLDQLTGKLVRLQGDELRPCDAQELRTVRLFIFYRAAQGNAPSRQFTPQLVEYYRRVKAQHPELELIYLSADRDEFNMLNAMRTNRVPWPAMRSGTDSAVTAAFCGAELPWLACVDAFGNPLTTNAADKKFLPPEQLLPAIDYLLAHLK